MCGLAGFLGGRFNQDNATHFLQKMADSMSHRGPDDSGVWFDEPSQIGLGHRRLSILDLSAAGHQPMMSHNGRYVFVFNGEIYNHQALRRELTVNESIDWRGHSDTETLLAGFEAWGIQATIEKAVGMFAFAVWDKKDRVLTLGRDRVGEKPLYYGWQQGSFLFGSELKALTLHPAFHAKVDRNALPLLLRYSTIPAPHSIWQGIQKLMPGCLLSLSPERPEPKITAYWSAVSTIDSCVRNPFIGSAEEAVLGLERVLHQSISQQMVADVPVGVFLSGGVDSSTVVALMQAQSSRPVRSFSIGFHEAKHNEAPFAKAVAAHLKTDHTEFYVRSEDTLSVIAKLPYIYDEPFADSSQVPTFLVSQLAKQQVQVSLSGDGGDELFCGYNRYVMVSGLWRKFSMLPISIRRMVAKIIYSCPVGRWDQLFNALNKALPRHVMMAHMGDKFHKGAGVIASPTHLDLYRGLISAWNDPASVVLGASEPSTLLTSYQASPHIPSITEEMMALDLMTYLPDDILTKVDRAAMGVSLETRVPFLDHRVIDFAWKLPLDYKLRKGVSKWALREVLYKYVPKHLIERPKMGFGMPIDEWLRGSLRDWAEALLDKQRLADEGFFEPHVVRQKWEEHLTGRYNWQSPLWSVLMFQAWLEKQHIK